MQINKKKIRVNQLELKIATTLFSCKEDCLLILLFLSNQTKLNLKYRKSLFHSSKVVILRLIVIIIFKSLVLSLPQPHRETKSRQLPVFLSESVDNNVSLTVTYYSFVGPVKNDTCKIPCK
jgi:hypothetical protein